MLEFKRSRFNACRAGIVVLLMATCAAQADFYLVRRISLGAYFGALGNNPFAVTSDGTYAYIGGYYGATATPSNIGILKINLSNPTGDATVLPGGNQTVNQNRYYGGLVVSGGVLYALTDRPDGTFQKTNVRAIDVNTGQLVATFDGDFGDGDGIVFEPAAMTILAIGGLGLDPGVGGLDTGLSLLGLGSGRRCMIKVADGTTMYTTSTGMIVADSANPSGCAVSDMSSWRDHVFDAKGNVYMRRSNQVQMAIRSGSNSISGYRHLTDELNADGTPKAGCGDGMPVAMRVAPNTVGQNIALISKTSAGSGLRNVLIFNDRYSGATTFAFADVIKMVDTNGVVPNPPVQLLRDDGSPLSTSADVPIGAALYDFHYDAVSDVLLILDYWNRSLLVFSGTQPCHSPAQDFDGSGAVDLVDYAVFEMCLAGPNQPYPGPPADPAACRCADRGKDNDVDLMDAYFFQLAFTP